MFKRAKWHFTGNFNLNFVCLKKYIKIGKQISDDGQKQIEKLGFKEKLNYGTFVNKVVACLQNNSIPQEFSESMDTLQSENVTIRKYYATVHKYPANIYFL